MPVESIEIDNFRCIAHARLVLHPQLNLLVGPNASGKTSLLEALFFVGRGRSFRASQAAALIQHQKDRFRLVARIAESGQRHIAGVEYDRNGFRVRIDGEDRPRLLDLAQLVTVSVVDAEVHDLVQGTPGGRRRFTDWGVFHVEPSFLDLWKRYQRLLQQRNALLRGRDDTSLDVWNAELALMGESLSKLRRQYLAELEPVLHAVAQNLLGRTLTCRYRQGWDHNRTLLDVLHTGVPRDRLLGSTQHGPHRADLELSVDEQPIKDNVSRGEQKMVASALVLAQLALFCEKTGRTALLLLDDPAAELDQQFLQRLLAEAQKLPVQLVITGLSREALVVSDAHRLFHVEQGVVQVS